MNGEPHWAPIGFIDDEAPRKLTLWQRFRRWLRRINPWRKKPNALTMAVAAEISKRIKDGTFPPKSNPLMDFLLADAKAKDDR